MKKNALNTALYENFWTVFFNELDQCQPHEIGSSAEKVSLWRSVISHSCKDGVFFNFDDGERLTFEHRSSYIGVEAFLKNFTAPLDLNLGPVFPDFYDISTINIGAIETNVVSPQEVPIAHKHIFWTTAPHSLLTDEEAKSLAARTIRSEAQNLTFAMPLPPGPIKGPPGTRH